MIRLILLAIVVYLVWQGLERLAAPRSSDTGGRPGPEARREGGRSQPTTATPLLACSNCGVHFDPLSGPAADPPVCTSCQKVRRLA